MNNQIVQGHATHVRVSTYLMGMGQFCINDLSDKEIIDDILEWAKERPGFDDEFVLSMQGSLQTYGRLTEKQSDALKRIARRWHIYR